MLARGKIAPNADREARHIERSDAHSAEPLHRNANRVHHVPHQVIGAFVDHHLQDEPFGRLSQDAKFVRNYAVTVDHHTVAHPLQHRFGRTRQRQDVILLVEFIARMHDPIGHIAVIRQEEQSFGVAVKASDRIDPFRHLDEVHHGPSVPLVLRRRDIATWLVQDQVSGTLGTENFAVDTDLCRGGIDFRAKLGHDLTIDTHPTFGDHGFRAAPRCDASGRKNAL
ncbi:MAG: hypothetical protein QOF73_5517 [Thermomicrobiales bacterium]|nr:hypothetical protein [Thermomicrobiales bacterium]